MRKLTNINDIVSYISCIQPLKMTLCREQLCKVKFEQLILRCGVSIRTLVSRTSNGLLLGMSDSVSAK